MTMQQRMHRLIKAGEEVHRKEQAGDITRERAVFLQTELEAAEHRLVHTAERRGIPAGSLYA